MRKKMTMAAVAAMMAVSAYVGANSLTPSDQLSGIMLENVEALASVEESDGLDCYKNITPDDACTVRYCQICDYIPGTFIPGSKSKCKIN